MNLTESIIVQPGIPTNAVYNTSLTIDGIAAPVTLALTSDDSLPEATYAFSSPTINEFPYEEVTLTATLSASKWTRCNHPFYTCQITLQQLLRYCLRKLLY